MTFPGHCANLRHVTSWDASGFVEQAWKRLAPPTRERLAEITGIDQALLSRYNNGQRLGVRNARKIADAVGISVLELGAPAEAADERGQSMLDRLQALEEELAKERRRFDRFVRATTARLAALEETPAARGPRSAHPPKEEAAR